MSRKPFDVEGLGAPQEEVAVRLRAVRESNALSLREFAHRLSSNGRQVSHTAVAKYEIGELKITPDYLELVSRAFSVPYGWFLSGLGADEETLADPAMAAAGLEFLPRYLHKSVSTRLGLLADWCGIPAGPVRVDFYEEVGSILRVPFSQALRFTRQLTDLSERELSVFIVTQFAALRTVLRRFTEDSQTSPDTTDPPQV